MEVAQLTRDIRHISGKNNLVADFLSRGGASDKIGDVYKENDNYIAIAAMETVQLQGISLDALASRQKCEEIEKFKLGSRPPNCKFETVDFQNSRIELFCETSSNNGP